MSGSSLALTGGFRPVEGMTFPQILTLARVPNIPTVWSNVLMAWVIAGGDIGRWPALLLAMLGGTLIYAGGCTLNDAFDARWDRENKPDRLIPSGRVAEWTVWILGISELVAGWVAFAPAGPDVLVTALTLVVYVLVYDFRHKQNSLSVFVMACCRGLLVLLVAEVAGMGNAAGYGQDIQCAFRVWAAALVLLFYIIALSLLARRESRPGGGLLKKLRPTWSVGRWVGEMLAAIPLLDALLIFILGSVQGKVCWMAVLICVALWPLCRLLQRKFAAT